MCGRTYLLWRSLGRWLCQPRPRARRQSVLTVAPSSPTQVPLKCFRPQSRSHLYMPQSLINSCAKPCHQGPPNSRYLEAQVSHGQSPLYKAEYPYSRDPIQPLRTPLLRNSGLGSLGNRRLAEEDPTPSTEPKCEALVKRHPQKGPLTYRNSDIFLIRLSSKPALYQPQPPFYRSPKPPFQGPSI